MPYITQTRRRDLDPDIERLSAGINTAGDLNYAITQLALGQAHEISYTRLNSLIGVLECAKLELYRRVGAPYEDSKAEQNGDVY